MLRVSTGTPTQLLRSAAGADGQLSGSADLATLLSTDDLPLIPSDAALRSIGQPLIDASGRLIGRYHVWLRNDNADSMTSTTDTNEVLTLLSIGQVGSTRKVIEVTIQKGRFPNPSSAVNLIETSTMSTEMDPRLKTINGLEGLAGSISRNATDVFSPPAGTGQAIGDIGSPTSYRVATVNGDASVPSATGYGILLVRGELTVTGNFTWTGLVLVIGKGIVHWNRTAPGAIYGGLFVARTRADDGTLLSSPGNVTADFDANNIYYDPAAIKASNQTLPYSPIAIRER